VAAEILTEPKERRRQAVGPQIALEPQTQAAVAVLELMALLMVREAALA
jgi:hypothetical protein